MKTAFKIIDDIKFELVKGYGEFGETLWSGKSNDGKYITPNGNDVLVRMSDKYTVIPNGNNIILGGMPKETLHDIYKYHFQNFGWQELVFDGKKLVLDRSADIKNEYEYINGIYHLIQSVFSKNSSTHKYSNWYTMTKNLICGIGAGNVKLSKELSVDDYQFKYKSKFGNGVFIRSMYYTADNKPYTHSEISEHSHGASLYPNTDYPEMIHRALSSCYYAFNPGR